jgi:hypothetical protein
MDFRSGEHVTGPIYSTRLEGGALDRFYATDIDALAKSMHMHDRSAPIYVRSPETPSSKVGK